MAALVELVANALDARASLITIEIKNGTLQVIDDGDGMTEEQFVEYHDFAATTKERGTGIGFAGQGAKLALNFCSRIVTETRSKKYHGATLWRLEGDRAPYDYIEDKTLAHNGTRVTLYLNEDRKDFFTPELVVQILEEQYYPLLDQQLVFAYTGGRPLLKGGKGELEIYKELYRRGLRFVVNGSLVAHAPVEDRLTSQKEFSILRYGAPQGWGFFGLAEESLPEHLQGVAIATYGKVIERTYLKKEPRNKEKIFGWIEAPYLVKAVTTDKSRFQRGNKDWEGFFRKAQAEFTRWLEEIGLIGKPAPEFPPLQELEREMNEILRQIPGFTFFGARMPGVVAIPGKPGEQREPGEGVQKVPGTEGGEGLGEGVPVSPGPGEGVGPTTRPGAGPEAKEKIRVIRGGIRIAVDNRPEVPKEAWFDGETVTINTGHPAFLRASKDKEVQNYHIWKASSIELIRFAMEKDPEPSLEKGFDLMGHIFELWGKAQ